MIHINVGKAVLLVGKNISINEEHDKYALLSVNSYYISNKESNYWCNYLLVL